MPQLKVYYCESRSARSTKARRVKSKREEATVLEEAKVVVNRTDMVNEKSQAGDVEMVDVVKIVSGWTVLVGQEAKPSGQGNS